MRTDVDRQLYLYQCSNKSICSSVYFLWLWPRCSERQRRFNTGGREGRAVWTGTGGETSAPWHFLPLGLPFHFLNTTSGPSFLHHQIPGKYELVSTCTAQTNTGPLFFLSFFGLLVVSFLQNKCPQMIYTSSL